MRKNSKASAVGSRADASDGYLCLVALISATVTSTAVTVIGIGLALLK